MNDVDEDLLYDIDLWSEETGWFAVGHTRDIPALCGWVDENMGPFFVWSKRDEFEHFWSSVPEDLRQSTLLLVYFEMPDVSDATLFQLRFHCLFDRPPIELDY